MPFFRGEANGIGVDLIDGCNLNCVQCFYLKSRPPFKCLSEGQVANIIIQAKKVGFKELYTLGGEPTLHPRLANILAIGLKYMPKVILVTNGIKFADSKYCQTIALPGLDISMHRQAINPKHKPLVDKVLGRQGAFELKQHAWKNIQKYWQGKVCVQLNLLRPLVEKGCVMEVFKWARDQGFEPIMELSKSGPFFSRGCDLDVSPIKVLRLYEEMRQYDEKYYPSLAADVLVPPSYGHNCTLIETGVHITVNGDVLPCVGHSTIIYGNVFRDKLKTILRSPIRQAIQNYEAWIVGPCTKCPYFLYCHGGCRGEAVWATGCLRASDPYCWHHPPHLVLKDMAPKTCEGCILENYDGCKIKISG